MNFSASVRTRLPAGLRPRMKSLFDHFPDAIGQNAIRTVLELHQECLVSFLFAGGFYPFSSPTGTMPADWGAIPLTRDH